MADVSKIKIPNGTVYDLKDETARAGLAGKAAASHKHTKSEITDFPASLPANGGNADTVGGVADAYHLGTINPDGIGYGNDYKMYCQYNAFGDGRFGFKETSGKFGFRVDYASNAANTAAISNKGIDNILSVCNWYEGDLNDLKKQCSVIAVGAANSPSAYWGTVLCFGGGTGSWAQIYVADDGQTTTYIRHHNGAAWSTWKGINYPDSEVPAYGYLPVPNPNVPITIPLKFTPWGVLLFDELNRVVNSGFSLSIGENQFTFTKTSLTSNLLKFVALRGRPV